MKLGFLADLHLANHRRHGGPVVAGLNRRAQQAVATLGRAVARAKALGVDALFLAGDVFDDTRPEPQIVAAVQQELTKAPDCYVLAGNHDLVSDAPGDHALGPLVPVAKVLQAPSLEASRTEGVEALCVPFQPGDARQWLPAAVAELSKKPMSRRVLVTHVGIEEPDTPRFMQGAPDAVPVGLLVALCQKHGIQAVFAGNWHGHRVATDNPLIVQIGALVPTGWDNPGLAGYGTLVVYDTATLAMMVEAIPGPRFLSLRPGDPVPEGTGCDLYLQVKAARAEEVAAARATLVDAVSEGMVVAGDVGLDDVEARAAARTAATVARSAKTLEEALVGYVGQMALPEGVDRAAVLAGARKYLGV